MPELKELSESSMNGYSKKRLVAHIKKTIKIHNNKLFQVRRYQYIWDQKECFFIWNARCKDYVHYLPADSSRWELQCLICELYEDIKNNS